MRKTVFILLSLLLLYLCLVSVSAGKAYPSASDTNFIVYKEKRNMDWDTTYIVVPATFQVTYTREEEIEFKSTVSLNPFDDPGSYKYEVVDKEWGFDVEPKQIYEGQYGKILITYFVSLSANPYATRAWLFWISERVKVKVSATLYVRIDVPPDAPVTIRLSEIVGIPEIPVSYNVTIMRISPSTETSIARGTIHLVTETLFLKFFRLYVSNVAVEITSSVGSGKFDKEGYIMVAPVGNILVGLCLDVPYVPRGDPPLIFEGKLVYRNQYQLVESRVRLNSIRSPCDYPQLRDVVLIPGSYRNNSLFPLVLKSGAFEIVIPVEIDIPGVLIAASTPMVLAKPVDNGAGGYIWEIEVQVPVNVVSFQGQGGTVKVTGTVQIGETNLKVDCNSMWFSSPGIYTCTFYSNDPPYNPSTVYSGKADLTVHLESMGTSYSDTSTAMVIFLTHTSVQYVVSSIYRYLVYFTLGLLLVSVVLYFVQAVFNFFGINLPFNPVQMMLNMSVITVLIIGLPYVYSAMFSGLCSMITDSQLSDFRQALGCPVHILGMKPEDAIARFFSYYDMLIAKIRSDYSVWVVRSLIDFGLRLVEIFAMFLALLYLAIALIVTMNSPVAGSIASALLTFCFSAISIFVTLIPMLGLVLVFTSLVEIMLVVVATLMLAIIPVGTILLLAPSPSLQVYGENMLGAGFFYLLLAPGMAPIMYALYVQVSKVLNIGIEMLVRNIGPISVPLVRGFFPPVDLFIRVSGYVVLNSIILGMVVFVNVYLLTRTGLMASIGESLAKIMRR
ncbi:MAG: hypothetical protein QW456_05130 [Ignisphaera sp.]